MTPFFRPPLEAALFVVAIASAVRAFHTVRIRPSHITPCNSKVNLQYSKTTESGDLWNDDFSPSQQQQHEHARASSILPEYADDPSMANRARYAMMYANNHHPTGSSSSPTTQPPPPAVLESRCAVNLQTFNNGRCKAQWLHVDPPVFIVDNFLTEQECDDILRITISPPPAGVGRVIKLESRMSESNKANNKGTAVRLSTTWYVRYGAPQVAPLLRSLLHLLPDIQLEQTEEVQLVRYMGEGQGFGWHEDTLSMEEASEEAGGQRIATLLVYLDESQDGSGRTLFRDLRGKDNKRLGVSPKKGRALLFFPAITTQSINTAAALTASTSLTDNDDGGGAFGNVYFDNTRADHRTTHAGEPPSGYNGQKHIAQLWIHSGKHTPRVFGKGVNKHSEAVL
jgi:hypothetical protein